jgi:hypothetical protein
MRNLILDSPPPAPAGAPARVALSTKNNNSAAIKAAYNMAIAAAGGSQFEIQEKETPSHVENQHCD